MNTGSGGFMQLLVNDSSLTALNMALRAALKHDPATRQRLLPLTGKSLLINVTSPRLRLYLSVSDDSLEFSTRLPGARADSAETADAELRGSLNDFIQAMQAGHRRLATGIHIRGDSGLVLTLTECLQQLDIDWEGWLADHIGDLPAHQLAESLRSTRHYFRDTRALLLDDLADYLHEEVRLLPTRVELEYFYDQVDELRLRTDRVQARLQLLQAAVNNSE